MPYKCHHTPIITKLRVLTKRVETQAEALRVRDLVNFVSMSNIWFKLFVLFTFHFLFLSSFQP